MEIGAQFYTVRQTCQNLADFAETLKKVADIGYRNVQISGTCPYPAEWLKENLDKNGLKCVLTHIPVVRLTKIFRQARTSRIVMNAHQINRGILPDISNGARSDFFFMDMEKQALKNGLDARDSGVLAEEAARTIAELVSVKLSRYYHVPASDVQVLTPMQRGVAGAANLNQLLQQALNPGETGLRRGGFVFKPRDKVMQIRNNYDKEVFNGDIGYRRDYIRRSRGTGTGRKLRRPPGDLRCLGIGRARPGLRRDHP